MLIPLLALALQATDPTLDELKRAYDQTCNNRVYGQFDDLCSDMADRVRAYERELRRRPKAKPAPPPASAAPPTAPPPSPDPPPPAPSKT